MTGQLTLGTPPAATTRPAATTPSRREYTSPGLKMGTRTSSPGAHGGRRTGRRGAGTTLQAIYGDELRKAA